MLYLITYFFKLNNKSGRLLVLLPYYCFASAPDLKNLPEIEINTYVLSNYYFYLLFIYCLLY